MSTEELFASGATTLYSADLALHCTQQLRYYSSSPPCSTRLMQMFFDVVFSLLNRRDLLCILIRDLQLKLLLKGHNKFDQVERICVEVFNKRCAGDDLAFINPELIDDNFLQSFRDSRHYFTSLSAFAVGGCCARLNIVPRTPLTKRLDVLLPNCLASSTASLIAAFAGTVLLNRISWIASLRIFLSIRAICCNGHSRAAL